MKPFQALLLTLLLILTIPVTLGCSMHEHDTVLISRIILKPAASAAPDDEQPLGSAYLQGLQTSLPEVRLTYIRRMGLVGVHVLELDPAQTREAARQLTETLSARTDVDYAEPDYPRQRR